MNRHGDSSAGRRLAMRRALVPAIAVLLLLAGAAAAFVAWPRQPRDPNVLLELALSAARSGDMAETERLLQRALERAGGRHNDAQLALATLAADRADWKRALELFAAVELAACRSDLLLSFGRQALAGGKIDQAEAAFGPLRDRPDLEAVAALELLLPVYHQAKRLEDEVNCVQELVERDPDNPQRWWALISLLQAKQAHHWAIDMMRQAREQQIPFQDRLELHHRIVEELLFTGDVARGRQELESLLELDANSARVLVHQANLYRMEARPQEAMAALEEAIPKMPAGKMREAIRLRAILNLDLGRFDRAAVDLQAAIEESPFDQVAHAKLADAYRGMQRFELADQHQAIAEEIKRKRLQINKLTGEVNDQPDNLALYDQIAELHRELNEADSAQIWERRRRDRASAAAR